MLTDGTNSYTYNAANRLTSVTNGTETTTFAYNGLGNRLQQTINGAATTYQLDLNTPLPQVLSDGTNSYLYGNGRIGEYGTSGWAYHHADTLGSVRLLTNGVGNVTGSASYTPFGEVMGSTAGSASAGSAKRLGFAGEQTDQTGLQYLRARYYAPEMGRFLTTDPYAGRQAIPYSLHPYKYGFSNPLRYIDPSGLCAEHGDEVCWAVYEQLVGKYPGIEDTISFEHKIAWHELSESQLRESLALSPSDLVVGRLLAGTPENPTAWTNSYVFELPSVWLNAGGQYLNEHSPMALMRLRRLGEDIIATAQRHGFMPQDPCQADGQQRQLLYTLATIVYRESLGSDEEALEPQAWGNRLGMNNSIGIAQMTLSRAQELERMGLVHEIGDLENPTTSTEGALVNPASRQETINHLMTDEWAVEYVAANMERAMIARDEFKEAGSTPTHPSGREMQDWEMMASWYNLGEVDVYEVEREYGSETVNGRMVPYLDATWHTQHALESLDLLGLQKRCDEEQICSNK